MTGPPRQGPGEPWWARPGGAPPPRRPQGYPPPRPVGPPPQPWRQAPPRQYTPPPAPPAQHAPQTPPPRQPAPAPPRGSRRRIWVLGALAVAVVAVMVAVWTLTSFDGKVLDVRQAEAGVAQILSDPIYGYGANDVTAVECNGGENPKVEAGKGFNCLVSLNGVERQVAVVFRDDAGTYEVDGPR
ncbi:DUF4333 domain-containing protein [Mycolicibacterium celeriflavum]|uniref:DUF4333 domain-containing protein n=1 Tax=Mycolicibacterium celeriflavum TaxID=1249101 RepID=UPI001F4036DD|nr:DUF4333 domain-containing protein [Mycolicibacterium celeriflavum]